YMPTRGIDIRPRESELRPVEEQQLYSGEAKLGTLLPARIAFTNIELWTGAPGRQDWTVLFLGAGANAAAKSDGTWRAFMAAVLAILRRHPFWRVTCESDCDQEPLEKFELAAEALVDLLDSYRATRNHEIAFYCESAASEAHAI
ncbi:MAG TPA: hypothetical protein VNC50_03085, partial [Planctomycetia bacterium]|nr:hypothetical protein [Planctomycetia bacterium]